MAPDRDGVGNHAKDVPPVVANGKVYLATFSNQVNVYGVFATPASITESLSAATLPVAQGGTGSVTATVTPGGNFSGIVYFASSGLPAGATLQFSPSTVNGAAPASTIATVSVASSVAVGSYPVTITASSGVFSSSQQFTLVVSAPTTTVATSTAYNLVGITNDSAPTYGNIDGAGSSLSSALVPAKLTVGGVPFSTGPTTNGTRNVIGTAGQTLTVPSNYYASLNFIGFGVNANQSGQFTINYSDGTQTSATVSTSNWVGGPKFGEAVALTMSYRNTASGKQTGTFYIYEYSVTANPAKKITGIKLPANSSLIVLAITGVAQTQAPVALTPILQISAGGGGSGTFVADKDFSGGTTSTGANSINTASVTNPAPAAVYQSERWGPTTYTIAGLSR